MTDTDDNAYIQELKNQAHAQFIFFWRENAEYYNSYEKEKVQHAFKLGFIQGALESSKMNLLDVENRLEKQIEKKEELTKRLDEKEEHLYALLLEIIGPEAAASLKGSYTQEGVVKWFNRTRTELGGLSPREVYARKLEDKYETVKQLALNLRMQ